MILDKFSNIIAIKRLPFLIIALINFGIYFLIQLIISLQINECVSPKAENFFQELFNPCALAGLEYLEFWLFSSLILLIIEQVACFGRIHDITNKSWRTTIPLYILFLIIALIPIILLFNTTGLLFSISFCLIPLPILALLFIPSNVINKDKED